MEWYNILPYVKKQRLINVSEYMDKTCYNHIVNMVAQYLITFFLFRLEIIRAINTVRHDFVCIVYAVS